MQPIRPPTRHYSAGNAPICRLYTRKRALHATNRRPTDKTTRRLRADLPLEGAVRTTRHPLGGVSPPDGIPDPEAPETPQSPVTTGKGGRDSLRPGTLTPGPPSPPRPPIRRATTGSGRRHQGPVADTPTRTLSARFVPALLLGCRLVVFSPVFSPLSLVSYLPQSTCRLPQLGRLSSKKQTECLRWATSGRERDPRRSRTCSDDADPDDRRRHRKTQTRCASDAHAGQDAPDLDRVRRSPVLPPQTIETQGLTHRAHVLEWTLHENNRTAQTRRHAMNKTPWGRADSNLRVADGIYYVTTPSHGGYHLTAARVEQLPAAVRDMGEADGRGGRWFEEDCEWAAVCIAFPERFSPEAHSIAHRSMQEYHPQRYARLTASRPADQVASRARKLSKLNA